MRTVGCDDCGATFTYEHRPSSPRSRCDGCRAKRAREVDRARLARWRGENHERIVRVPGALWAAVDARARERGGSVSDVIREALEKYVS